MITDYLSQAIEFIEDNVKNKITIDDIAEHLGISKYYLHRMMTRAIGRPLMEYVRSRKLAESLEMLIYSEYKIIDVCNEYGFSYEQTYIKAFKREYGITPNMYRKGHIPINITQKFDAMNLAKIKDGVIVEPFFITKQSMKLVGIRYKFTPNQNDEHNIATHVGNDFFFNKSDGIANRVSDSVYIGYSRWRKDDPEYNVYMPSVEVSEISQIPEGMYSVVLNNIQYAVFRYIGNIDPRYITWEHLSDIKEYVYLEWLITSRYRVVDEFDLEYIDLSVASDGYCEVDFYVPVRLKK